MKFFLQLISSIIIIGLMVQHMTMPLVLESSKDDYMYALSGMLMAWVISVVVITIGLCTITPVENVQRRGPY